MLNLKESIIPREINYRKVEIENEIQQRFALDYLESKIPINGKDYKFILNKDFSISILEYETNNLIENVENNQANIFNIINGKKVIFVVTFKLKLTEFFY